MVRIKCYSMEEALKRLYKGETLYNISQDMEIEYNVNELGKRKTDFDDDIIVSKCGEYVNGFNKDFINEYIRLGGFEGCAKYLSSHSTIGILSRTLRDCRLFQKTFEHIHSRVEPERRTMSQFEIMGWANSDDSKGWLVRVKFDNEFAPDGDYSHFYLPQRLNYDYKEMFKNRFIVSYQRAKLLPDHNDIDKSTIQGFTVQDTHYEFFMETSKKNKQQEHGYER